MILVAASNLPPDASLYHKRQEQNARPAAHLAVLVYLKAVLEYKAII
jgi:hypothetical protein